MEDDFVSSEVVISLLTIGGTLLLVVTGLLNYSVFVRQLRAAREQLETARRQLESARQQPEIQLVQRAMDEASDHPQESRVEQFRSAL
jgi:type II secretory pathway pseudopilin PulG